MAMLRSFYGTSLRLARCAWLAHHSVVAKSLPHARPLPGRHNQPLSALVSAVSVAALVVAGEWRPCRAEVYWPTVEEVMKMSDAEIRKTITRLEPIAYTRVADFHKIARAAVTRLGASDATLRKAFKTLGFALPLTHTFYKVYQEGHERLQAGAIDEAIKLLMQASTEAANDGGDMCMEYGQAVNDLSVLFAQMADYGMRYENLQAADECLTVAHKVYLSHFPEDSPVVSEQIYDWACVKFNRNKHAEALTMATRAHELYIKHFGDDHVKTKDCKHLLEVIEKRIRQ